MTSHLLDTNACIDHLRYGSTSKVSVQMAGAFSGTVAVCSVVVAELEFGARRNADPSSNLSKVRAFCRPLTSLPFDDRAAEVYARIKADLFSRGAPIGPNDLFIAAIARANSATLVSHNTVEFSRIAGLRLEDWQASSKA